MPPFVLAAVLFSALLHAGWNAVLRHSGDRDLTVAWIGLATFFVSVPFAVLLGFPTHAWVYVLISSALHVVYLVLLAKAYKLSELSFAYPIARGSSPMLVALGGLLWAAEKPSAYEWLGIGFIVVGILAIGLESKSWDVGSLLLALAIGGVIAIYTVTDALGARLSPSSGQYNAWEFSFYGIAVTAGRLVSRGPKSFRGPKQAMMLGFAGGVTSAAAYAIVVWGMVRAPMGSVSAIRESSTLFATAIALIFLKESFSFQKLAGSASIVAGAILIGVRG